MTEFYKLEIDKRELSRIFADLPIVTKKASANTINFVARKVNANLKAHVADRYNVPKKSMTLGKLISIARANARTNRGTATIYIKREGRGLMKYSARENKPHGVTVKIKKSTKRIKSAYISPMRKGGSDLFVFRKGQGKNAGKVTRLTKKGTPYEADKREILYGAPIADLYTNLSAKRVLVETVDREFQPELDKQMHNLFEKKR